MASNLKEQGNDHYKSGRYQEAIECYNSALKSGGIDAAQAAVLHNNKAACYLKMGQYEMAQQSASECLRLTPKQPKALFRRSQACTHLDAVDRAYKDISRYRKMVPNTEDGERQLQKVIDLAIEIRDQQGEVCEMEIVLESSDDSD